jgi:biopolymer transport protein ExbB/TolQ
LSGTSLLREADAQPRRVDIGALSEKLEKLLRAGDFAGAAADLKKSRSVEAEIIGEALRWHNEGPESVEQILSKAVRERRKSFESGLLFLGTLGNNAPFIGLFGTVLGIVTAFRQLGSTTAGQSSGMGNVMSGIAEALIATAVGILVALPAVIAYNIFQKKGSEVEENSNALGNLLLAAMKRQSDGAVGRDGRVERNNVSDTSGAHADMVGQSAEVSA